MPEITVPLRAPELAAGEWVQGPPVSLRETRAAGRVALVEFWECTCVNCLRTLPYVARWHRRYADRGLVVVGVHTPEFDMTRRREVVAAAVRREAIPYPVLLDAAGETWNLFANKYWPARYLVDVRGYLRYEHFGEGAYGETERAIQSLLREAGDRGPMPAPMEPLRPEDRPGAVCHRPTREMFLGSHRGRMIGPRPYRPGEEVDHPRDWTRPPEDGYFTARGRWYHDPEYLEAREAAGSPAPAELEIAATAATVSLVAEPPEGGAGLEVHLATDPQSRGESVWQPVPADLAGPDLVRRDDGATVLHWTEPRLLRLLVPSPGHFAPFAPRRLRLRFRDPGTRVYAISFTGCVVDPPET